MSQNLSVLHQRCRFFQPTSNGVSKKCWLRNLDDVDLVVSLADINFDEDEMREMQLKENNNSMEEKYTEELNKKEVEMREALDKLVKQNQINESELKDTFVEHVNDLKESLIDAENRVVQAEAELKKSFADSEECRRHFSQEIKELSNKVDEKIKAVTREADARILLSEKCRDGALEEKQKCEKSISDQISKIAHLYRCKSSKEKMEYEAAADVVKRCIEEDIVWKEKQHQEREKQMKQEFVKKEIKIKGLFNKKLIQIQGLLVQQQNESNKLYNQERDRNKQREMKILEEMNRKKEEMNEVIQQVLEQSKINKMQMKDTFVDHVKKLNLNLEVAENGLIIKNLKTNIKDTKNNLNRNNLNSYSNFFLK